MTPLNWANYINRPRFESGALRHAFETYYRDCMAKAAKAERHANRNIVMQHQNRSGGPQSKAPQTLALYAALTDGGQTARDLAAQVDMTPGVAAQRLVAAADKGIADRAGVKEFGTKYRLILWSRGPKWSEAVQ